MYASDQSHSSVPKAALLAGFGADNLRLLATDDDHALRVDLLEAAVRDDLAAGRRPCAVVAAVGTTATTALDPVARIAGVAQRHGLWLHLDAALAGTAMICPELRWMWEGVEHADSLVLNPHKWMGTGFDLSAYYVRDPEHLIRVMSTDPSYLRTAQDGLVRNLRDWGIPLGRRFRALKLWFLLREYGVSGLQGRVRRDLANAVWLAEQIDAAPGWERLAPVPSRRCACVTCPAARRATKPPSRDTTSRSPTPSTGAAAATSPVASQGPADDPRLDRRPGYRAIARGGAVARSAGGGGPLTRGLRPKNGGCSRWRRRAAST